MDKDVTLEWSTTQMPSATLWIVATPIGNSEDLSPRARAVLQGADLILAEDTRRADLLFKKTGINPRQIASFFEHNETERQAEALTALQEGKNVALITDAGTPLISDPGFRLVRECRGRNIRVSPVPGPCAPIAALSAAGIPPIPFAFLGFLPRGASDRLQIFRAYAATPGSLVFFERKSRLAESLQLAYEALGPRKLAICRELTKIHEQFILGRLESGAELAVDLLGEITVVIGSPEGNPRLPEAETRKLLLQALASGLKPKQAAKVVKPSAQGWSTADLYALIQSLRQL